jgi:hypothetical protein
MLSEIQLPDMRLSAVEELALCRMLDKRESYVEQGRFRDAHGLGTGIWILWTTLLDKYEPARKTNLGELT